MDRTSYLGFLSSIWDVFSVLSYSTLGKPVQPNSHGTATGEETGIVNKDMLRNKFICKTTNRTTVGISLPS